MPESDNSRRPSLRSTRDARRSARFVGRNDLVAAVSQELTASQPAANVVSLTGIGGIGKSSVVRELRRALDAEGKPYVAASVEECTSVVALASAFRDSVPPNFSESFLAFDALLGRLSVALGKLERVAQRTAEGLRGTVASLGPVGAFVANFVGEDRIDDWISQYLSPEETDLLRTSDSALATELMTALSSASSLDRCRPLIIIDGYEYVTAELDQWLREDILSNDHTPPNVVLLIAGRDPLQHQQIRWAQDWNDVVLGIELDPLPPDTVESYFRTRGLSDDERIEGLVELSCGLPWAMELLADLSNPVGQSSPVSLADAGRLVVARLLDQLEREQPMLKPVVEAAAVLPRFDLDLVRTVAGVEVEDRVVEELPRFSFVRRLESGDLALHDVVAEHVRRHLLEDRPVWLHSLTGRAAAAVADRRNQAEPHGSSWFAWLLLELRICIDGGLEYLAILPPAWLHAIGATSKYSSQLQEVLAAVGSERANDPALAALRGHVELFSGDPHQAIALYEKVVETDDPSEAREAAVLGLVEALHRQGRVHDALDLAQQELATSHYSGATEVLLMARVSEMAGILGDLETTREYSDATLRELPGVHDPAMRAHIALLFAHTAIFRHDYAAGADALAVASDAWKAVSDEFGLAQVASAKAWLASLDGNFANAFAQGTAALGYFRGSDYRFGYGLALLSRGELMRRANEPASGLAWNRSAVGLFDEVGSLLYETIARTQLGACLCDAGLAAEARRELDIAIEHQDLIGEKTTQGQALFFRALIESEAAQTSALLLECAAALSSSTSPYAHMFADLCTLTLAPDFESLRIVAEDAERAGYLDIASECWAHAARNSVAVTSSDDQPLAIHRSLSAAIGFNIYQFDRVVEQLRTLIWNDDGTCVLNDDLRRELVAEEAALRRRALPRTRAQASKLQLEP